MNDEQQNLTALQAQRQGLLGEISRLETLLQTRRTDLEQQRRDEERLLAPLRGEHDRLGRAIAQARADLTSISDEVAQAGRDRQAHEQAATVAQNTHQRAVGATTALEQRAQEAQAQIDRAEALGPAIAQKQAELEALTAAIVKEQQLFDEAMANVKAAESRLRDAQEQQELVEHEVQRRLEQVGAQEQALKDQLVGLERDRAKHRLDETAVARQKQQLDATAKEIGEYTDALNLRQKALDETGRILGEKQQEHEARVMQHEAVRAQTVQMREEVNTQLRALAEQEELHETERVRLSALATAFEVRQGELDARAAALDTHKTELDRRADGMLKAAQELQAKERDLKTREQAVQVAGGTA